MTYEDFKTERNEEYEKVKKAWEKDPKNKDKTWDLFRPCKQYDKFGKICHFLPADYMDMVEHRRLVHRIMPHGADVYEP